MLSKRRRRAGFRPPGCGGRCSARRLGISPDASPLPSYARVLALSARGRTLLRRQDGLPLIVKPVTEKQLPDALQPSLRLDAFADDLFGLARPAPLPGGEHYRKTPFYLT